MTAKIRVDKSRLGLSNQPTEPHMPCKQIFHKLLPTHPKIEKTPENAECHLWFDGGRIVSVSRRFSSFQLEVHVLMHIIPCLVYSLLAFYFVLESEDLQKLILV